MPPDARVELVSTGTVGTLPFRDRTVPSAFAKTPVAGDVRVGIGGLDGDEQGDPVKHGGPDKAICAFAAERCPHFERWLGVALERTGFTSAYRRVLAPGTVRAGDAVVLESRPHPAATITEANRVMHRDRDDRDGIARLLDCPQLGASWRRTFTRRLAGTLEDPDPRRRGPA